MPNHAALNETIFLYQVKNARSGTVSLSLTYCKKKDQHVTTHVTKPFVVPVLRVGCHGRAVIAALAPLPSLRRSEFNSFDVLLVALVGASGGVRQFASVASEMSAGHFIVPCWTRGR